MRNSARPLQQIRYLYCFYRTDISLNKAGKIDKASIFVNPIACHPNGASYGREINKDLTYSMLFSRALCSTSEKFSIRDSSNVGGVGPLLEYEKRIAMGELVGGDSFQIESLRALQRLYEELVEHEDNCQLDRYMSSKKAGRSRWLWSRLMPRSNYSPIKGLYLYGGVGTGKTMLMDLFYNQLPSYWRKKRMHFHDFMLNVHRRLQMHKGVADPLEIVAAEISDESILLCLDEFMVTDVADALILNRLFQHLFSNGMGRLGATVKLLSYDLEVTGLSVGNSLLQSRVRLRIIDPSSEPHIGGSFVLQVLVSTSNRAPDQLYEGGLQRDLFLPFIDILKERCVIHEISSSTDYRKLGSAEKGYYFIEKKPTGPFTEMFNQLIGPEKPCPQVVEVAMGRKLQVPLGANGYAYFTFEDLCDRPLGAADYLGLFKKFHTLALEGVPKFGLHNRTAAYRFVTLVDVMYENKAVLLCTAEASPVELFEKIVTVTDAQKISPRSSSRSQRYDDMDLCVDNELGFAKERTISRLTEMNSKEYLEQHEVHRLARH